MIRCVTASTQRITAFACCLAFLSLSCGSTRKTAVEPPQTPPGGSIVDAATRVSADEQRALFNWQESRIQSCMTSKGFSYKPRAFTSEIETRPLLRPLPVPEAEATGYGTAKKNEDTVVSFDIGGREKEASSALFGTGEIFSFKDSNGIASELPADGCIAESDRAAYGSDQGRQKRTGLVLLITKLRGDEVTRIFSSTPVIKLNEAWSRCMTAAGFSAYTSPDAAASAELGESESRRLAVADAGCRLSTDYDNKWQVAASPIQRALFEENFKTFDAYQSFMAEAIARTR
jgi:hypothetical protein